MATKKQKLELTWIGKDERPRLEPRILLEDKSKSTHAATRVSENDIFENILIKGDNLLALKSLEQEYSGKVKCIYIDPPYNTGSAFEHYDDGLEHSMWLSLIRDRVEILHRLMRDDGSLWISIDDREQAYLRVLLDETFGRSNFVATIIWEKRTTRENRRVFSFKHDYVLVFAKNRAAFELVRNPIPASDELLARYKNPDSDPRGPWQSVSANAMAGHATASQFYTLEAPSGAKHDPPAGRCWLYTKSRMLEEIDKGNIWFGRNGLGVPRIKKFLRDYEEKGLTPETIWMAADVGTTDSATKALTAVMNGNATFNSPKPEGLISRILQIASNPGELVLDSFGGSGTTAAVAHKMNRRWIMVELGPHCYTHIIPRLTKIIDGEDNGGITQTVDWKGGGGFRFYELAPSLLKKDRWDNFIINPEYNAEMLAEAMCKQLGFIYEPSDSLYWMHGHSTESDFVYVTTQNLARETLRAISDDVGDERTLLICCKAFRAGKTEFPNLTLEKIPNAILSRCEWDKDDYSLQIENLPMKEEEIGIQNTLLFDDEES